MEEFKRGRPHKSLYKDLNPRTSIINRVRHVFKASEILSIQIFIKTMEHPFNLIINGASTDEGTLLLYLMYMANLIDIIEKRKISQARQQM